MTEQEKKNLESAKKLLIEINNLRRKMNEEPLDFGDKLLDNFKNLPGLLEESQDRLRNMDGSINDLYQRLKQATSEIKNQEKPLTEIRRSYRNLTSDVNKLRQDELGITKLSIKELTNLKKRVDLNQNIIELKTKEILESTDGNKEEQAALEFINKRIQKRLSYGKSLAELGDRSRRNLLDEIINTKGISDERKALIATYVGEADLQGKIGETVEKRVKEEEKIVDMYNNFSVAEKAVKEIPFLGELISGPFEKAKSAAKEAADAGLDAAEVSAAGMKAFGESLTGIFTSPLAQIGAVIALLKASIDLFFAVDKMATDLGKSMALAPEEANKFRDELNGAARASGDLVVRTETLIQAQQALAEAAGATRGFKEDELIAQTRLVERMGVQADTAGRLANLSRINGINSEDALDSIISSTQSLMEQEGIQLDIRDVTDEVANTSGQLAATLKNNPTLIGKAVVQARRLGLELAETRDIAKGLLDFESSISSELEAELLTGKQLSLERARLLALQGNFLGATEEIVRQVGSLSDFQNMNVIQQEAIAKAANMSVDQFADMLQQQKNLTMLGKETRTQIEDRARKLREEGKVEEANQLLRRAGNEEDAKAALMRLDAQQQFEAAVAKVKDVFVGLADQLPIVIGLLTGMAVMMAAVAISAIFATGGIAAIGGAVGAAVLGGMLAGFGVNAMTSGDTGGVSAATKKAEGDREKYAGQSAFGENEVKVNDFTLNTNPADTFSLVGGTSLTTNDRHIENMSKDIKDLKEVMKSLKLTVNLDGQAVGDGLVMANYKS